MTVPQDNVRWVKSTRSQDQGDCVELSSDGRVRDSKNADGPTLRVDLRALIGAIKR